MVGSVNGKGIVLELQPSGSESASKARCFDGGQSSIGRGLVPEPEPDEHLGAVLEEVARPWLLNQHICVRSTTSTRGCGAQNVGGGNVWRG